MKIRIWYDGVGIYKWNIETPLNKMFARTGAEAIAAVNNMLSGRTIAGDIRI